MKWNQKKAAVTIGVLFLAALLLSSCSKRKNLIVLLPSPSGESGQILVENATGAQLLSQANQATDIPSPGVPPSAPFVMTRQEIDKTFGDALSALPPAPTHYNLYFKSGTLELAPESVAQMQEITQSILSSKPAGIVVTGHTDRVGAKENNFRLALTRAEMIKQVMISKGVAPSEIEVTSHGEDNPLVKTDDEIEEPLNRRVEIVLF